MKKVFITGMALVVATTIASNAMAATAARPRAAVIEKMEEVTRDSAFGKGHTAKDVTDKDTVITTIAKWLEMPGMATKLKVAIKSDSSKADSRLDSLALSYAAVKVGEKVAETDKGEGNSLIEAGRAQAELLAVADLKDSGKKSTTLSADEHATGIKSIEKLESENVKTLKDYSTAERDSWTAIKKEYSKTVATASGSPSEALVQSIMTVMKVDRTKAIEIMKKLSDCV